MSVLELKQVNFAYPERQVIASLSLQLERGEFLGVVGPNGAGKSTLLRLASGLMQPQTGTISIDGQPLSSYRRRAFAKKVAIVTQEESLEFPFTALEVV